MSVTSSPEATAATDTSADAPVTTVATLEPVAEAQASAEAAHGDTHTTTAHAEEHASGGLPQFQTEHWAGQMVWLVIIFLVLFVLIAKVFAPRLRKVIDTRGATIAEDLANARAIRDEAEAQAKDAAAETAAAHVAARKLAADAKAKAAAEQAAAQAKEDARLNAVLAESEASIRAKRDEALSHVTEIATDTASALIEKLTGKAPTKTALTAALKKA
ncbi:hypothetical protein PQU92_10935 [Asticcacaulis sp. BYS171W]|uniref:ATP synthase subunit b n=1 Tax=Asticcacaulis aquaticus TaxID=2984212 RepID=A0ABT5HUS2_9CAUL|nr:hypothetical protein [Asticcacaulis aquaticus]MDC7683794.1 hypothetical protein [Asticcacaulis aquaticus]